MSEEGVSPTVKRQKLDTCEEDRNEPKVANVKVPNPKSTNGSIPTEPSGVPVLTTPSTITENTLFGKGSPDRVAEIKQSWEASSNFEDDSMTIQHQPFRHGELKGFIQNQDFVKEFANLFTKIDFNEKASDLFQFKQSDDLNSVVDPHVYAVNEYLLTKVLPFLKNVTGLPLNETVDMFLSIYTITDFLLCHDDELDSRRIAFIWYLSEEWSEDYGGTLDFYTATDKLHPDSIVKKVVPEFNKFVFFEVGATSYHQVSEVTEAGKKRLALSGWFYGEPLARPKIEYPLAEGANVIGSLNAQDGILKKMCAEMYLNPEIYTEINEQLGEESEVLVPGFLRDDIYEEVCKAIVDMDVSKARFTRRGPPNIGHFEEALAGPPGNNAENLDSAAPAVNMLWKLFYSSEFLNFMEKITEFPFTTCPITKVVSSLQKYSHGCYSLLRSGGTKQTGITNTVPEQEVIEEEEEPNLVDVMFYFANKWNDERGGLLIYSTTDGEQLITVPPEGNCLAVVVRSSTVNSYTNYVNCFAKDDIFFVYKMTFAFDGNISAA